jgi:hypothetical protein
MNPSNKGEKVETPTAKLSGIRTNPIEIKVVSPTDELKEDKEEPETIEDDNKDDYRGHERTKKRRVEDPPKSYDPWHVLDNNKHHFF